MAHRPNDPFSEPAPDLRDGTNPYLPIMRASALSGELPIRFGSQLKGMAGTWSALFAEKLGHKPEKLIFEIGCHLGKTLCEIAADHPNYGFIGADITFKRVCTSAQRTTRRHLNNVICTLFNAKFTSVLFEPGELDATIIFFPDPWTKERKAKHRLIQENFVQQLFTVTKPLGSVWFKTDQAAYYEQAVKLFEGAGFVSTPKHMWENKRYFSTFEQKFLLRQLPTYEVFFVKP